MGLFDFFIKEKYTKDTIVIGEENVFLYVNKEGVVSLKYAKISLDDDDRIHGEDLSYGGTRTYLKEQIIKVFGEKELRVYSEKKMQDLVSSYQKKYSINEKSSSKTRIVNTDNNYEVCFTGFKALEKAELINLAKSKNMIVRTKVTSNINMLVCGPTSGPSKMESAKEIGISITDVEGFKKFIDTGEI
ncbi:MAG: BRCT domain-containing protein [Gammaproteobacteria bacterium]